MQRSTRFVMMTSLLIGIGVGSAGCFGPFQPKHAQTGPPGSSLSAHEQTPPEAPSLDEYLRRRAAESTFETEEGRARP